MMREQSVSPYLGLQEAEDAMDANARGVVLREQLIAKRKSCVIVLCAECNEEVINKRLSHPGAETTNGGVT